MFYNCSNLENIEIPENVIKISRSAFGGCVKLEKIRIPKNVAEIATTTFYDCGKLSELEIDEENKEFTYENGILLNRAKTSMICILPIAINGTEFTVPNTVQELTSGNITVYKQITKLNLPASINWIDAGTFLFMNITNITIDPENKNYMATDEAVYNKEKSAMIYYFARKENVTIEEGLRRIGSYCFSTNTKMKTITLPSSLNSIGSQAFWKCNELQELSLSANITNLDPLFIYQVNNVNVTIDKNNKNYTIENNIIFNKDKTKLITIIGDPEEFTVPDGVKEIGDRAFHAKNVKKVTIPETVTKIGVSFNYCGILEKIEFPSSVKEISDLCFVNSKKLKEVIINNKKGAISGEPWGCSYGERAIKYKY